MKYYIIYEEYTEYNQFEGIWEISYKEFGSYQDAKDWIEDSFEAEEARRNERKLIGPLNLVVEEDRNSE